MTNRIDNLIGHKYVEHHKLIWQNKYSLSQFMLIFKLHINFSSGVKNSLNMN